ncbi:MAG: hypothetical protein GY716_07055 [bacterium]|nr:hypothetical protein [bacterium]
MRRLAIPVIAALALGVVAAGETSESEKKKDDAKPAASSPYQKAITTKRDPEAKVYTNADLEKMSAGQDIPPTRLPPLPPSTTVEDTSKRSPSPDGPRSRKQADPLEWMEGKKQRAEAQGTARAEVEERVGAAESRVAQLEKQLRSVSNPLLPRAWTVEPEDAEKKAAWDGADNQGKLAQTKQMLEEARAELAAAKQELDRLR